MEISEDALHLAARPYTPIFITAMEDILDKPDSSLGLRDNSQRAKIAMNLLLVVAIISLVQSISGYFELNLLQSVAAGNPITMEEANASDLRQTVIGFINLGLVIVCAVVFIQWFRRAYANLERADIDINNGHSMALWGFIIPIVNLFKPRQIALEIASGTREKAEELIPEHQSTVKTSVINGWWFLFIVANIISNLAFRWSLRGAESLPEMITISQMSLFSSLLDIPAALLARKMIGQIAGDEAAVYRYQSEKGSVVEPLEAPL